MRQSTDWRMRLKLKAETMNVYSYKNGFTMLEILAVLLVIGIISAIVISRASSTTAYSLDAEVQIIKSHLRHAQVRALSDDVTWGIAFSSNSYTLRRDGVAATANLPNENGVTHNLAKGVIITSGAGSTVTFNNIGSPGSTTATLTLSASGQTQNIIITKNTGFIP